MIEVCGENDDLAVLILRKRVEILDADEDHISANDKTRDTGPSQGLGEMTTSKLSSTATAREV
jgi:hypothetical protein